MIVAEVSIVPLGAGSGGLSSFVAEAVKALEQEGLHPKVCAMGTTVEAESWEQLFRGVRSAKEAVFSKGAERVLVTLKVDESRKKEISGDEKVRSVESRL